FHVTGVQTCALPISPERPPPRGVTGAPALPAITTSLSGAREASGRPAAANVIVLVGARSPGGPGGAPGGSGRRGPLPFRRHLGDERLDDARGERAERRED